MLYDLLEHPPRTRMPCLLVFGQTGMGKSHIVERFAEEMINKGEFREDLYYRLNVATIQLPPLRERPEDIPLLATHFLRLFSRRRGCTQSLANEALACLGRYDFPGNVRELKNIIEQVSVLAPEPEIGAADLPIEVQPCAETDKEAVRPLGEVVAGAEQRCIAKALARCGGNRSHTAALLGISRKNLWEKMRRHGIGGTG